MVRRISAWLLAGLLWFLPFESRADPRKDLEEGIAAYEDLGLARARLLLTRAAGAEDAPKVDRARAYFYLGLLEYDLGNLEDADAAWSAAFSLDPNIEAPEGTSPKTIRALEAVRARVVSSEPETPPVVEEPPVSAAEPVDADPVLPAPPVTVEPRPPFASPPPAPPDGVVEETSSGISPWVWVGVSAGAVAVAAGVLAAVVASKDDLECSRGGGGCVLVSIDGL